MKPRNPIILLSLTLLVMLLAACTDGTDGFVPRDTRAGAITLQLSSGGQAETRSTLEGSYARHHVRQVYAILYKGEGDAANYVCHQDLGWNPTADGDYADGQIQKRNFELTIPSTLESGKYTLLCVGLDDVSGPTYGLTLADGATPAFLAPGKTLGEARAALVSGDMTLAELFAGWQFRIELSRPAPFSMETRAGESYDEETVESAAVFVFAKQTESTEAGDKTQGFVLHSTTNVRYVDLYLTAADEVVYAVCNHPNPEQLVENVKSLADLQAQTLTINAPDGAHPGHYVMTGHLSVDAVKGGDLVVPLYRLAARHEFTIRVNTTDMDKGDGGEFKHIEAYLCNLPRGSRLLDEHEGTDPLPAEGCTGDYTYATDPDPAMAGEKMRANYFTSVRLNVTEQADGTVTAAYDEIEWYWPATKELEQIRDDKFHAKLFFEGSEETFFASTPSSSPPAPQPTPPPPLRLPPPSPSACRPSAPRQPPWPPTTPTSSPASTWPSAGRSMTSTTSTCTVPPSGAIPSRAAPTASPASTDSGTSSPSSACPAGPAGEGRACSPRRRPPSAPATTTVCSSTTTPSWPGSRPVSTTPTPATSTSIAASLTVGWTSTPRTPRTSSSPASPASCTSTWASPPTSSPIP